MILSKSQYKFVKILINILDKEPHSDMAGYTYLYKDRLNLILFINTYDYEEKKWLNELGKYYKKFIGNTI